jgi:fido (protein-threonine AMPylation protein)
VPIAWDDDSPAEVDRLTANIASVLRQILNDADRRTPPTVAMAQQWHRDVYAAIDLPVAYYAGEIRDSDPRYPELFGYEVRVGHRLGVLSRDVPAELETFEHDFAVAVDSTDSQLLDRDDLDAASAQRYVTLAAVAHGEWIRIHPFANGNGRTARLWTHWLAARYGLTPLMAVKPRPLDALYADASASSMTGDHRLMRAWLLDQLLRP